jgi:hypothetical protein
MIKFLKRLICLHDRSWSQVSTNPDTSVTWRCDDCGATQTYADGCHPLITYRRRTYNNG